MHAIISALLRQSNVKEQQSNFSIPARILITGGTGLLGLNWAASIKNTHDVTLGVHHRCVQLPGVDSHKLSLESVDNFLKNLDFLQPDYVVHAAGLASVDLCEKKPDLAHHVNVELAENVARACALRGIQLAHISTDHLFRGDAALLVKMLTLNPSICMAKPKLKPSYVCEISTQRHS